MSTFLLLVWLLVTPVYLLHRDREMVKKADNALRTLGFLYPLAGLLDWALYAWVWKPLATQ